MRLRKMPLIYMVNLLLLFSCAFSVDYVFGHGATGVLPTVGAVVDVGGATTFSALTDTPGTHLAKAVPFTNSAGTALLRSAGFVFDGTNLGIGTANPSNPFTCNGNAEVKNGSGLIIGDTTKITADSAMELQVLGTGGADSGAIFARFSNDLFQPHVEFVKSRATTIGGNTIVLDGDVLGGIHWHPDDGVDYLTTSAKFVARVDDSSPAVDDIGAEFIWSLSPGAAGAMRDVMWLRASGYLGLGINNPLHQFHSSSTISNIMLLEADSGNALETDTPEYRLRQDGGDVYGRFGLNGTTGQKFTDAIANYTYLEAMSGGALTGVQIVTGGIEGQDDGVARITVLHTGEVGINTNAPNFKLEINGTIGIDEQAGAAPDVAGKGQFWVKDNAPNDPMFTDDIGADKQLATVTGTETLTNKRITKKVGTLASSASITINVNNYDMYTVTALAVATLMNNPSGTPTEGQQLMVRIKDDGTARAITWNTLWRAGDGFALPSTTVVSETMYLDFMYNAVDNEWDMVFANYGF